MIEPSPTKEGHMYSVMKTVLAALVLMIILGSSQSFCASKVALVVGNSEYPKMPLTNPRSDAKDVAIALRKLGFHVIQGLDLDKASMEKILKQFAASANGAEASLFFYAGHGLQVNGQNYLVPTDAALSTPAALELEMVRLDLVQKIMESTTKTNILLIDACRNNPLVRSLARAMGTRSAAIGTGLARIDAGVGTLISFSTQPDNTAGDGTGRNSPYTKALLKRLDNPVDDLASLLVGVRNDVISETQNEQVPWENSALTARFYFVERFGSVRDAMKQCVRGQPHPSRKKIVQQLVTALNHDKSLEYGWYGGAANSGDNQKASAYPVSNVKVTGDEGDEISLSYAWENGTLQLMPILPACMSCLVGTALQGVWTQNNGIGCVEMDVRTAAEWRGTWSQSVGSQTSLGSFLGLPKSRIEETFERPK
jgi:hypothetical protein